MSYILDQVLKKTRWRLFDRYSNGWAVQYSNCTQPLLDNLNTRLIWYSDPHCDFLFIKKHFIITKKNGLAYQEGIPIIMAGIEMQAIKAIPTGAPTIVPNCQSNFFFLDLHKKVENIC